MIHKKEASSSYAFREKLHIVNIFFLKVYTKKKQFLYL